MRVNALTFSAAVVVSVLGSGCSTTKQARSVEAPEKGRSAILADYKSLLEKGKDDEALLIYIKKDVDWNSYTKAQILPVIFNKPEGWRGGDLEELQKLANYCHGKLQEEIGKDVQIVADPGPNTGVVQVAVFNPERELVAANLITGVMPIGIVVSGAAAEIEGKNMTTGELSAELKVVDGVSNELLAAAVDRRVGRKYQAMMFKTWGEAYAACDFWAKQTRYRLCVLRAGGTPTEECLKIKP